MRFTKLDNTRKKSQFFFHREKCLFFTNLCFRQPRMCYRNDLSTSTVIVTKTLWAIVFCSLRSVTLDNTKKNRPKFFVAKKTVFFEMFVSLDLLCPKEMI